MATPVPHVYVRPVSGFAVTNPVRLVDSRPAWGTSRLVCFESQDDGGANQNLVGNYFSFCMLVGGEGEVWSTENRISRWHRYRAGSISAIAPGPTTNMSWRGSRHYIMIQLNPKWVEQLIGETPIARLLAMPDHFMFDTYNPDAPRIAEVVRRIGALAARPGPENDLQVEELGITLANHLAEMAGRPTPVEPPEGLNRTRLRAVIERIAASVEQPVSIQDLAKVAEVSPYHFCRMFKRNTGLSPWQFVMHWRVERAVGLLIANPRANLSGVAMACGFVDQSHLNRVFKRLTNYTPREFARTCQS